MGSVKKTLSEIKQLAATAEKKMSGSKASKVPIGKLIKDLKSKIGHVPIQEG